MSLTDTCSVSLKLREQFCVAKKRGSFLPPHDSTVRFVVTWGLKSKRMWLFGLYATAWMAFSVVGIPRPAHVDG